MKKTLGRVTLILITLFLVVSVVLSINVSLNVKIRQKVNEILKPNEIVTVEPGVYFLNEDALVSDPNAFEVVSRWNGEGKAYINMDWLKYAGFSYHYDIDAERLNIVGGGHFISIEDGGTIVLDETIQPGSVSFTKIEDTYYLDVEALNQSIGSEITGFTKREAENGSLVYQSDFLSLPTLILEDEAWLFPSEEGIELYYEQRTQNFFFDLRHIFYKTPIIESLSDQTAVYYPVSDGVFQVISASGQVGYVIERTDFDYGMTEARAMGENPSVSRDYDAPIFLAWEAVYSYNPNTDDLPEMQGVNVVSPTWYELTDASGTISEKVSQDYLNWADANDMEVWALVTNAFDIDRTHAFLHDANARSAFISYMIQEAETNGFEGINIDFENVYLADRDALTHFVNEFAWYASRSDITLSMDVTIMGGSDNWSKSFDHEALGKIVDFLIVMTYDEHWGSSPISGPVASYDWVQTHMTALANVVEPEKLIMGLPAYTRVWRERPSETQANVLVTSSSAIGLDAQSSLIERYTLTPIWDDVDKLYYATFFEEDALVKMWIENAETLTIRTELVHQLDLKGVAVWTRALASEDIWPAIDGVLNRVE